MRKERRPTRRFVFFLLWLCLLAGPAWAVDSDGDGVPDSRDNCRLVANVDQTDTDGDGYGNRCDADFNNDLIVNFADLSQLRRAMCQCDDEMDLDVDGQVDERDLAIFRGYFLHPPGPGARGGAQAPRKVYVGANAAPAERHAADEFIHFVQAATGIALTRATQWQPDGGPYFIIGAQNDAVVALADPPDAATLGEDGYEIRPLPGGHVLIAGANPRGTLYGVYGYLRDKLGWEWYAVDDPGTLARPLSAIPLPTGREVHVPRFRYREVFNPEAGDRTASDDERGPDFAARLMLNGQLGHRHADAAPFGRMLRARQGWGTDFETIYNIGTDSALTDAARQAVLDAVDGFMNASTARPNRDLLTYLRVEHIDGGGRSGDSADTDFAAAGDSPGAPLFELVRRAAEALPAQYDHLVLLGDAYLWSLRPPSNVTLPANAGVAFAPIEASWAEPLDQGYNTDLYLAERDHQSIPAYLQGWAQRSQHIWTWLYSTNFAGYLQPLPTVYPMIANIQWLARQPRVEGVFLQDSYTTRGGSFAALHAWVYGRLLWDPSLDGDALVRQFCNGYYGPAAGPLVYQYLQALHQSWRDHPSPILTKTGVGEPYLNAALLIQADDLMARASAAAAGNATHARRVAIERMGVDWVMLLNGARLRAQADAEGLTWPDDSEAKRLARWNRLHDTVLNIAHMEALQEGMTADQVPAALDGLRVARIVPDTPRPCAGVAAADCVDLQDLGFTLADALLVGDEGASDHGAARLPGDTPVWGIQIPLQRLLPESGEWILYARLRVAPGPDASDEAIAMHLGIYSPQDGTVVMKHLPFKALADGRYHTVRIDGWPHSYEAGTYIWFAPPDSYVIDYLYVDRVIAVRHDAARSGLLQACPGDSSGHCHLFEDGGFGVYSGVLVGDSIEDSYPNPDGSDEDLDGTSLAAWVADPAADDGSAAWAHRDNAHWSIQARLSDFLPAAGSWDIYARLRIDPHGAGASDTAFALGLSGTNLDIHHQVTTGELGNGYQLIPLPQTGLRRDQLPTDAVLWFQTDHADLWVDRLIAVPEGEAPASYFP